MVDLLRWSLQKHEKSKDAARKRLQLILVLDRIGVAPDLLEAMKTDIMLSISRYLVVDEGSLEMDMKRSGESVVLVSNIQVKEVVRTFAAR